MDSRRPRSSSRYRSTSRSSSRKPLIVRKLSSSNQDDEDQVPSIKANLDNDLPMEFFKQDILVILKQLKIHKWYKLGDPVKISQMEIIRISGALTNSIYQIKLESYPSLLLRIYGKNVDSIIDRDSELKVLKKLSKKKIGPKLLGIFTNGRFEQFLDGFITLNKSQIREPRVSQMIARRMKELHTKIEVTPNELAEMNLPTCWKLIYKWLDLIEPLIQTHIQGNKKTEEDFFGTDFSTFKKNIDTYKDWLFAKYSPNEMKSSLRFCHNDTQYGNLLLFKPTTSNGDDQFSDDKNLVVIDFEYSGINIPAFDLVNHFCEWMADYHNEKSYFLNEATYPNKSEQLNLIKSYIEYDFQVPEKYKTANQNIVSINQLNQYYQEQVSQMYKDAIYWRPSVQIFWSLWAVIQNGPFKNKFNSVIEQGPTSKYVITEMVTEESGDGFLDDEFNYIKYCQQKAGLFLGDLVNFGLIQEGSVDKQYIKVIDTEFEV